MADKEEVQKTWPLHLSPSYTLQCKHIIGISITENDFFLGEEPSCSLRVIHYNKINSAVFF